MISRPLALGAACAFAVLTATAAGAQDVSAVQDLGRTTEMAAQAAGDVTLADAFTPGPAEPPPPQAAPPARRPAYRNPWTSPRPTFREAFSQMAAAFRSEFRQTLPPARNLAASPGPEPVLEAAADIDFTVADAFDAQRLAAPSAASQGVQASASVGEPDDGVDRARALNRENASKAAAAVEAYEAAQRDYEQELARWREQLGQ